MQKPETPSPTCTTVNSKWIKDVNISHDTIKVPVENIGRKISDIPHSNIFANIYPRAREIRGKKNPKWDYIKLKSFCTGKDTIVKRKRQLNIWENIFANDTLNKCLISKIYRARMTQHQEDKQSRLKNGQRT